MASQTDVNRIILESLDNEDPNVLRAACLMAGAHGLAESERGLLKALAHKAWQVQAEAAKALGRIGSTGAVPYLKRLLKASESDLRPKMISAAAGGQAGDDKDDTHPRVKQEAAIALNRLNPALAQDALVQALGSDQPQLLNAAMVGLANLQADAGGDRIVELLAHEDEGIRRVAAACSGRLRLKAAVPGLINLLGDESSTVRKEAAIALNHLKDKQAIGSLSALMDDADQEVRRVAAIALGNTRKRTPEVVVPLIRGLNDHDAEVRLASLSALANCKAVQAIDSVGPLLADSHEKIQAQAAVTLVTLNTAKEQPDYPDD